MYVVEIFYVFDMFFVVYGIVVVSQDEQVVYDMIVYWMVFVRMGNFFDVGLIVWLMYNVDFDN